ncbi:DeoR/GlpR family DNA-binding transcription regulator [Kineococcus sp. SYSU DK006]|uniref:DeoR/GlpR family DNA-binding transcription regulator n=1 Tax=Kineococcus sp. SYSU DK006 TaxID=3383127 RepID=UPI003D7C78CD
MQRSERHRAIVQAVSSGATVTVDALCALTGASPITVRRDLTELAEHGSVRRVRGGATRADARGTLMPFSVRFETDRERKDALAAVVAGLVADHESLVLDNGTTCYAVARHLVGRPLTALALSLHSAAALAARPGVRTVVPGGPVETDTLAFTGSAALAALADVSCDVAVLGACAALPGTGLTSTTYEDAQVKRACLRAARRRVLVTTADKLVRTSTFRFGGVGDLTHLVTTDDVPDSVLAPFRAEGVQVHAVAAPARSGDRAGAAGWSAQETAVMRPSPPTG